MRILYIASKPDWGGATVALYNLIKQIYKEHEINVVVPNGEGRLCDELNLLGIKYYVINYKLNTYYKSKNIIKSIYMFFNILFTNSIAKKELRNLISKIKPDIVHCNVGPIDISLDSCLKLGIPHVWHIREYQDLDFNMTFIPTKKHFLKRIHTIGNYNIAITKDIFSYWKLREGIDRVIYDPVMDTPPNLPLNIKKKNYFLFVGRIEKAKGVYDVIKGFSKFCALESGYKLKIAGSYNPKSAYYKKCILFIRRHKLENQIEFLGHRNDVYDLMQEAKAQIVASRFEGFGFITAEAMFNKCLIIGKNTAGTKEQMDNGMFLLNKEIALRFNNIEEMTYMMVKAIKEDNSEIINNAYHVVNCKYTSSIHAKNILNFYSKLISKK